jgi:hypothetical protein
MQFPHGARLNAAARLRQFVLKPSPSLMIRYACVKVARFEKIGARLDKRAGSNIPTSADHSAAEWRSLSLGVGQQSGLRDANGLD